MNIVVASSGGPTCAINSSIAGVYCEAVKHSEINKVFGAFNGIEGIIHNHLIDLKTVINDDHDIELLKHTPSTVLGSCRYKLPSPAKNSDVYKKIIECFKENNIKAFLYIGGNDSMDTVSKLSKYAELHNLDIKIIGIPKTIDNDLDVTDHTPGFGSAAKYVAASMLEITRDSMVYSGNSVTVVEIMGRDAGWLTASSCLLRTNGESSPHLIYLPESEFSVNRFLNDIHAQQAKHKAVIAAVSEGIKLEGGNYAFESSHIVTNDAFGHAKLSGVGKMLEHIISKEIQCKVRSIELNVMQRCSSHIASLTDIEEAAQIGGHAVLSALNGESGKMMIFKRISNNPYSIEFDTAPIENIANKIKHFPSNWISPTLNDVSPEALDYFIPLIQGELNIETVNGMPKHFTIKRH